MKCKHNVSYIINFRDLILYISIISFIEVKSNYFFIYLEDNKSNCKHF